MRVENLHIRIKSSNNFKPNKHICFRPLSDILIYGKPSIFVKYHQPCITKNNKVLSWEEVLTATNPEKFSHIDVNINGEIIVDGNSFYLLVSDMVILRTKKLKPIQR